MFRKHAIKMCIDSFMREFCLCYINFFLMHISHYISERYVKKIANTLFQIKVIEFKLYLFLLNNSPELLIPYYPQGFKSRVQYEKYMMHKINLKRDCCQPTYLRSCMCCKSLPLPLSPIFL